MVDDHSTVRLRIRDTWGSYALLVFIVGAALAAAGGLAVAGTISAVPLPGDDQLQDTTETEERTVQVLEATGDFQHGATVRQRSNAFRRGEQLSNRQLYFTSVAPVLDGTHQYTYDATDGDVQVTTDARLVIREVDEEAEYWEVTEPLESTSTSGVAPGDVVETEFSVNVSAVDQRADAIREELGASPGTVESVVIVRTTFEGTVDGQPVSESMTTRLEIDSDGDVYRVDTEESSVVKERTTTVTVDRDPSILEPIGGGLLLLLGCVLVVATVIGTVGNRFELSRAEEHALERAEFEEWITTARVPTDATDRPVVPISSLEGLVDLAIDTDGRVIHDEVSGQYVLFDDTFTYIFIPQYVSANTIGVTTQDEPVGPPSAPEADRESGGSGSGRPPGEQGDGSTDGRAATDADRAPVADSTEASFGGWIITEPLAEDVGGDRTVPVSSLAELVGLAVDADRPVIRDANSETYVLFDDDATYAFNPDDPRAEEPGDDGETTGDDPPDDQGGAGTAMRDEPDDETDG